jgi:hypothetical protein
MNKVGNRKHFVLLASICLVEGVIALIALLVIPADQKNAVIFGYSLQRLILIISVLIPEIMIILLLLAKRKDYWGKVVDTVLRSKIVIMVLFLTFFAGLSIYGIYQGDHVRLLRISPVLIFFCLLSLQMILYQISNYSEIERFGENIINWLIKIDILLCFSLFSAIPLLFASAISQYYPLGYAGLYTMMAEAISKANFQLPMSVPFYGPGGIPFAYPPLGLYFMALFLKLGISTWAYLRFAPPVFSLLSLIPLFLLTRRLSKSNLGGMVASLLAAGSFYLFFLQTESGGIVRGLAFGLGLLSIYFFDRMIESFHWRDVIFSGVMFGMAVLTHLGYAYYFAFWMVVWVVTHPKRQNWVGAGLVAAISTFVALPWIIVMLNRYGASMFSNAFMSHDNFNFLSLFQNPVSLFQALLINLRSITEQLWLFVLVMTGLVILVAQKKFTIPLLFLLVLIIFQGQDRYILTVSFLIVGYIVAFIYRYITSKKIIKNKPLEILVSSIVIVGLFIPIYIQSFNQLSHQIPFLSQETLDMTNFLKEKTPSNVSYLSIITGDSQGDEWFPYLTQREPVLGGWGNEWTGAYRTQDLETGDLGMCITMQNLICVEDWVSSTYKKPDYIILSTKLNLLSVSFGQSSDWKNVFSNWQYTVWERIGNIP